MTGTRFSDLQDLLIPYIRADPESLSFAPVDTGKHNTSYWVDSDQGRFVLRIAPPDDAGFLFYERRMMRQEPELHLLMRAHTTIPIADIVGYDFSRTRCPHDYLVMEALPGTPLSHAGLSAAAFHRALEQVGAHLAQLHHLTAWDCLDQAAFGYLGSHRPMPAQDTWADAFRVMWNMLLDDVVACGAYSAAEARMMRDLLASHGAHFEHAVEARLLHMDVWGQNILVDDQGNVTGLLDFDRALWGDVEIEFAVLDYCGISEPAFWQGYGRQRDTSHSAMIRRQFYLLYEVQKYMPIRIWRRHDPGEARRYKQWCLALAAQLNTL